jgi:hypothetical protein
MNGYTFETVYIGVSGSHLDYGDAINSIYGLQLDYGDGKPIFHRYTKGVESRQAHFNAFKKSKHDGLLLLDADMIFHPNTLQRLRSRGLPFISGLYMRRRFRPLMPVWFQPFKGYWPYELWDGPIDFDKLHPIGASGWGCILIHRDVVKAVEPLLCGEREVAEDDLDIFPYDLPKMIAAIRDLHNYAEGRVNDPELLIQIKNAIGNQFRPLRADKQEVIGSDIRYAYFALKAGFQLFGDPSVRPSHISEYGIVADDFNAQMLAPGFEEQRRQYNKLASQDFRAEYFRLKGIRQTLGLISSDLARGVRYDDPE